MTKRYICPCCGESLLIHVRGNHQVGFCLNCHQEMPLIHGYENNDIPITQSRDDSAVHPINSWLESNKKAQEIIHTAMHGVWVIAHDQTTLFANPKLAEMLGYTVEEIQTKPFWKFIDEPHPICQIFNANQSLTQAEEYELKLINKQGDWIWVKLSILSLIDENSNYPGYLLQVFDLTDLKRIEYQLRQQTKQEAALNYLLKVIRSSNCLQTIFAATVEQLGHVLPVASVQIMQYLPASKTWNNRAEYQNKIKRLTEKKQSKTALNSANYSHKRVGKKTTVMDSEPMSLPLKISTLKPQNTALAVDDRPVEALIQDCPGAWLPIPLYCESAIWGCLSLVMQDPKYHWQTYDQTFIQSVANQLSIAIEQAELHQQLEQARLKFKTLSTLDQLTQLRDILPTPS